MFILAEEELTKIKEVSKLIHELSNYLFEHGNERNILSYHCGNFYDLSSRIGKCAGELGLFINSYEGYIKQIPKLIQNKELQEKLKECE